MGRKDGQGNGTAPTNGGNIAGSSNNLSSSASFSSSGKVQERALSESLKTSGQIKLLNNKANQNNPTHSAYWRSRGYDVETQDHVNFLRSKMEMGTLKEPSVFNLYKSNLNAVAPSKKPKTAPASMASIPVPQKNFSVPKSTKVNAGSTVHFATSGMQARSQIPATSQLKRAMNVQSVSRQKMSPALKKMVKLSAGNMPQGMSSVHKSFQKFAASVKRGVPKYDGKIGANHPVYKNVDLRQPHLLPRSDHIRSEISVRSVYSAKELFESDEHGRGQVNKYPSLLNKKSGPPRVYLLADCQVGEDGKYVLPDELSNMDIFCVGQGGVVHLKYAKNASESMEDRHVSNLLEDHHGAEERRMTKMERDLESMRAFTKGAGEDVIRDEVFVKKIKYLWILNALLPELYENIGIPDQFNSAPSIFPTLVTRYLCTFATVYDATRVCALIVQEDMLDLIRVIGQGGDVTLVGTPFQNILPNGVAGAWLTTPYNQNGASVLYEQPSYILDGNTSVFYVNQQTYYSAALNASVQVQQADIGNTRYYYVPVDAGSTFNVQFTTSDSTTAGYTVSVSWVVSTAGVLSVSTPAATNVTGNATYGAAAITAPTGAIGVYAFTIANAAAPSITNVNAVVVDTSISAMPADLVVGIGKSDGADIAFFKEFCSELRMISMSVRGMPYCSALGNLLFTGGQFLDSESDTINSPTFQNWSSNQLFFMKQMVDGSNSGFEFPLLKRDYQTVEFYNLDEDIEDRIVERGGVWLQGVSDDSSFVAIEIYNGLQGRPVLGIQSLDAKPGISCQQAVDEGNTFLNSRRLKFGNDDHVGECEKIANESVNTTYNISVLDNMNLSVPLPF